MTQRSTDDAAIERTIVSLLERRAPESTICPSEVARTLWSGEPAWRAAMPAVRRVAATMAARDELRVTRRGVVVDAESAGGPIRLGRPVRRPPDTRG